MKGRGGDVSTVMQQHTTVATVRTRQWPQLQLLPLYTNFYCVKYSQLCIYSVYGTRKVQCTVHVDSLFPVGK